MKFPALIPALLFSLTAFSQAAIPKTPGNQPPPAISPVKKLQPLTAATANCFVQNVGQYDSPQPLFQQMGRVQYGFEGFDMPVLFTAKGMIHLHRKLKKEEERPGKMTGKETEEEWKAIDKIITMEWVGANPAVTITAEDARSDYHTYGLLTEKARLYRRITYRELYPHIDVVFSFPYQNKTGFEYSIIVKPGGDPSLVKMKYGGDVKKIKTTDNNDIIIRSALNGIHQTKPLAWISRDSAFNSSLKKTEPATAVSFSLKENTVSFSPADFDHTQTLVIDPFVTNTLSLTGTDAGKAKDVDFDYDGNVYVVGGGSLFTNLKMAKYDAAGNLLWTFAGTLPALSWVFGTQCGGWVVDRGTGKTFVGQGVIIAGTRVIRLDANGVYDNFITSPDPLFTENWKMFWNCNNGSPQILIAGGGIFTNVNLAVCSPPATNLVSTNITGINSTFAQDIVDIAYDPVTNDIYSLFASQFLSPIVNDRLYKHASPYNAANTQWLRYTGLNTVVEAGNRPYMGTGSGSSDNSANMLSVNSSFLFYWDGLNLKAFNKVTGSDAGVAITVPGNLVKRQGGIYADECNNIFVGSTNGTIKVYKFDGSAFDDAAAPDIIIPDNPTASVYDLAYDDAHHLLYASGNGFVGSFDVSSYCNTTAAYTLSVNTNCPSLSAQAVLTPTPPPGTVVTYALFNGATQLATNNTGLFTGLTPGITYTIKAFLNQACSGLQLLQNFTLTNCALGVSATGISPACNNQSSGSITVTASGGTPPYQYSINGINFQLSNLFTNLPANTYIVTVKDAANNLATTSVTLTDPPLLMLSAASNPVKCVAAGSITGNGTGGTPPLQYSIDGINFQSSPAFSITTPAAYTLTVKDAKGCVTSVPIPVLLIDDLVVDAGSGFTICEGLSGQLDASSNGNSFVWTPATGLSDRFILKPIASPVVTTTYTLNATLGFCSHDAAVTVTVLPAPVPDAGPDSTICFGQHIQLSGSGGTQYQWRPVSLLSAYNIPNPTLSGTVAGHITYTLSVTDANGCHSLQTDAVTITIQRPAKLFAGNDTVIAINQPLPLNAVDVNRIGFINYSWSPVYGLNNPFIQNPIAVPDRDMTYTITASTAQGCTGIDEIRIKVYKGPEIYVPGAFTPNGDNRNDIMRAIPVGIKEFKFFTIYNRFGQMLFTTPDANIGWDGRFKGVPQDIGAFVWIAEGVDYLGNVIRRKGTFVLVR